MIHPKRLGLGVCLLGLWLGAWALVGRPAGPQGRCVSLASTGERMTRGARSVLYLLNQGLQRIESWSRGADPWPETLEDKRIRRRYQRVQRELAGLRAHPWAGEYSQGLSIAPTAGFVFRHVGLSCGHSSPWRGAGSVAPGAQDLQPTAIPDRQGQRHSPPHAQRDGWQQETVLHFVRWGVYPFAVPTDALASFYSQVHDGVSFPGFPARCVASMCGPADDEVPPRPHGSPALVPGFGHLLLERPVISCIVALQARPSTGAPLEDVTFLVAAGDASGLAVGMHLHVEGFEWEGHPATLVHVERESARLELRDLDAGLAESLVGRRVSTRRDQAHLSTSTIPPASGGGD